MLKLVINKDLAPSGDSDSILPLCYEFLFFDFHFRESVLNLGLDHPVTQLLKEKADEKREELRGHL